MWLLVIATNWVFCLYASTGPREWSWSPPCNSWFSWGQHFVDRSLMFPFFLWGHCNRSCQDKSRSLEGFVDSQCAQDHCSHCHGHCSPPHASEPPLLIMHGVCFHVRHFESTWCGSWHHNRFHNPRCHSRLALRHFHRFVMWGVHICIHKPSAVKGLHSSEGSLCWQTPLQVFGCVVWHWSYLCCHVLGLLNNQVHLTVPSYNFMSWNQKSHGITSRKAFIFLL